MNSSSFLSTGHTEHACLQEVPGEPDPSTPAKLGLCMQKDGPLNRRRSQEENRNALFCAVREALLPPEWTVLF